MVKKYQEENIVISCDYNEMKAKAKRLKKELIKTKKVGMKSR